MGYHIREIKKGVLGETSKIREELCELEDALDQDNRILAAVEMSDLYGALRLCAMKHGFSMEDLAKMSDATHRAFGDGSRK